MTISGDLIIDNLTPGSSSDSNIIEVGVSTNASHGYYLSATVGSSNTDTNLTNSENSNYKFTNLSSNASSLSNFNDNEWGYSYSTDGGTNWVSGSQGSTSSGYNGLPLDGNDSGVTGITLIDTTTPLATNQVKFKIGAKASNTQASGTYINTVNFYAVTHQSPLTFDDAFAAAGKTKYLGYYTMQDMTHDICVNTEQGFNTKLIDIRDNEIYTIVKLKDGNCWMLDNLRLGGDQPITLTNQDTNITATTWDLPSSMPSASNSYTEPLINTSWKNRVATSYGLGSDKTGIYYNYCAVSAGTYCSDSTSGTDISGTIIDSPYDICPSNWRLPTGYTDGEFQNLCDIINGETCHNDEPMSAEDPNSIQQILSTTTTGYYFWNNNAHYAMDSMYLWTSTYRSADRMCYFYSDNSLTTPSSTGNGYRANGFLARCLAK
ncbi:hypothetical protein IKE82_01135 [Candidatus Saccharibacteria bacterium]|nr:hypothetical protein [Candidatus Saccharibacteria bacterium]